MLFKSGYAGGSINLDESLSAGASVAVPTVLYLIVKSCTDLKGASNISHTLKTLGGGSMERGGLNLLLVGVTTERLVPVGVDIYLTRQLKKRLSKKEADEDIILWIEKLPVSEKTKCLLREKYNNYKEVTL